MSNPIRQGRYSIPALHGCRLCMDTSPAGIPLKSVPGLSGDKWINPTTRIAELLVTGFTADEALVIASHIGRADRL